LTWGWIPGWEYRRVSYSPVVYIWWDSNGWPGLHLCREFQNIPAIVPHQGSKNNPWL